MSIKIRLTLLLLSFPFFFRHIPTRFVYANLDDSIFVIKATWPADGSTNIPVDLKSGLSGSSYSDPPGIGNIAVGYGTDLSGGCGDPPNCPNIPSIKSDSISPLTITISSSNDPNIAIKYHGNGVCYGDCYGSESFYHNFSIITVNSALPNGIKLMPLTTYTITIKGGGSGIVAVRSTANVDKEVYLPGNYSWSFTTGDGEIPTRQAPTPSPTPIPTSTPSPSPTAVINNNQESDNSSSNEDTLLNPTPRATNSPTAIQQQGTIKAINVEATTSPSSKHTDIENEVTPSSSGVVSGVSLDTSKNHTIVVIMTIAGSLLSVLGLYLSRNFILKPVFRNIGQITKNFRKRKTNVE